MFIPAQFLNGHSLTLGGSGCGKTTKSMFLVLQIVRLVQGLMCFDFIKTEYRALRQPLAEMGIDLLVVAARQMKINPLQCPERVPPYEWASTIAAILIDVFLLPERAAKLINTAVIAMYRQFGIFDGAHNYPTLFDLYGAIKSDTSANFQARQAIIDALNPTLNSIPEVLMYKVGWTTSQLARVHAVYELGGISPVDQNLLLSYMVLGEFKSRIAQGISNPEMNLMICLDEAQRLISTKGSGAIAPLIGLVRGTGIGLDLSVQSADVCHEVMSNTANKFIGRCGSARDYEAVAGAMGLNHEQRQWLHTNLRPGLFVGQLGEGWRKPFVFEVPPLDFKKGDR